MPGAVEALQQAAQATGYENLTPPLQVALFLGGMVLLSGALVSLTAFARIIIVLSFVKRALAIQEIPPHPVMIGLSLFLTLFVMGPTFEVLHREAIQPFLEGQIPAGQAWKTVEGELRLFMLQHVRSQDLALFIHMADIGPLYQPEDTPTHVLIPAFIISELKTAFIMGFCIYIPFLLIDLVIAAVLMSVGMMMMPPVVISTPFKILLFVLVDGWHLIACALTASFG
ncbi:MAG: flagellar biosynthetic protein FliP [Planctomycetaceae bacterium]|nr:MAG: flagellar biosynthetic protein FliP [Planctomycetaceae bacterium]